MSEKKILDRLVIAEGSTVFNEGDRGDRAYVVQEGIIEIVRDDEHRNPVVLGIVEKGGIFGEMALIDDQPRMASARARVATTVIVVPVTCSRRNSPDATLSFAAFLGYSYETSAPWHRAIKLGPDLW